ncbi:unnamed protein product [Gongylonema pulchrum]|uniref:C2H2-type domain-containing protein n=1 Tax=Gongylonema pulchrum TaxID=637853 RepID=A0A183EC88_9BILA|nr:unnamed protein product [Gongylonema pulchrum]
MYSCPVAGCGHRYEAQSSLAVHYHSHFVKEGRGRAIYVETMGSQTDQVLTKDVGLDPVQELADSWDKVVSEAKSVKSDEKNSHPASPRPKLSKTLTNHEEQSINELFKVVAQKAETSSSIGKTEEKKQVITDTPRISSKTFGALLADADDEAVKDVPSTALDAIRKMVTDNETEIAGAHEQQSAAVITTAPASRFLAVFYSLFTFFYWLEQIENDPY